MIKTKPTIVKLLQSGASALAIGFLFLGSHALAGEKNTLSDEEKKEGFKLIFNGMDLDGWKVAENPDSFKVIDGDLATVGPRAHAFYMGKKLQDFELRSKVWFGKNSNGGIYFHATYKERGWPLDSGYEAQIASDDYKDHRKTGSIYRHHDLKKSPVGPNEWFDYRIVVKGRNIQTFINGKPAGKYTDSESKPRLTGGHIALQCHDPKSKVKWHTIRVKELQ